MVSTEISFILNYYVLIPMLFLPTLPCAEILNYVISAYKIRMYRNRQAGFAFSFKYWCVLLYRFITLE